MHLFLVRHLEYDNPLRVYPYHLPVVLSIEGRRKAKLIAEWFVKNNYSQIQIYSSPIVRAVQTAEIIASKTDSFVAVDEDLIEVRFSKLQGKPMPENGDWSECYLPGMQESAESILKRLKTSFQRHLQENNDCVLVSHGDNLTLLLHSLEGKQSPTRLDQCPDYIQKGDFLEVLVEKGQIQNISRHQVK